MAKRGPKGRYMPTYGSQGGWLPPDDKESIEDIFDKEITPETWKRLQDANGNLNSRPAIFLTIREWKRRNSDLKKRSRENQDPILRDEIDKQVYDVARAYCGHLAETDWDVINQMQKLILRDEKKYKELKSQGLHEEFDDLGNPVNDFCWLEGMHPETEAILSFYYIFEDAGFSPTISDLNEREKPDEEIMPTAFENFCFVYVFSKSVREVFDEKVKDGERGNLSFKYFQRIRAALEWRGRVPPKS
ncbi:hypothetical protein [Rhodovulum sp. FJ3]|uniref:hypothetical protein n=1 Tax=Rhodovulum sp. FJ3 TaxID=3079053 RepID=UPI00293DDE0B|nr:hypothetical protein [Rhodovulum sp. FJ3]MDV4168229.1 hypothetical protein [Rhodovulum sp. FJ3]